MVLDAACGWKNESLAISFAHCRTCRWQMPTDASIKWKLWRRICLALKINPYAECLYGMVHSPFKAHGCPISCNCDSVVKRFWRNHSRTFIFRILTTAVYSWRQQCVKWKWLFEIAMHSHKNQKRRMLLFRIYAIDWKNTAYSVCEH